MLKSRIAAIHAALVSIPALLLAVSVRSAQTKSVEPKPEKSSDPAIRWQFDTHG